MKIDEAEKARITENALKVISDRSAAPVILEISLQHAIGMIGNLQLAFRVPGNTGSTRDMMEKFVRDLIDRLDPERGDLHRLLMMGFDPGFDE